MVISKDNFHKTYLKNCGALRDLVPLVQFKRREKHPWWSVNFSKVAGCCPHLFQCFPEVCSIFYRILECMQIKGNSSTNWVKSILVVIAKSETSSQNCVKSVQIRSFF